MIMRMYLWDATIENHPSFVTFRSLPALYGYKTKHLRVSGTEAAMKLMEREKISADIKILEEELFQLEKALPPHGAKPAHYLRIEAIEEAIQVKRKLLAETG